jgi:hypothetical protein
MDEFDREICVMYRQMDGHPVTHGKDLYKFLKNKILVNGFTEDSKKEINGMNHLAAKVISHFMKKIPDEIYIFPSNIKIDHGASYIYIVAQDEAPTNKTAGSIKITCHERFGTTPISPGSTTPIFAGSIKKFGEWLKEKE